MSEPPDETKAHLGCFTLLLLVGFVQTRIAMPEERLLQTFPWFVWAGVAIVVPFAHALQIENVRKSDHPLGELASFLLTSGLVGWSCGSAVSALYQGLSAPPRWDVVLFDTVQTIVFAFAWRIAAGGGAVSPSDPPD